MGPRCEGLGSPGGGSGVVGGAGLGHPAFPAPPILAFQFLAILLRNFQSYITCKL